jgi:hypothetical protein
MDIYDQEIERLLKLTPEEVRLTWKMGKAHLHSPLFDYCTPSGIDDDLPVWVVEDRYSHICGCLTQVRASRGYVAWTKDLTARIKADENIPASEFALVPDRILLNVFAEWQRTMDKEMPGRADRLLKFNVKSMLEENRPNTGIK